MINSLQKIYRSSEGVKAILCAALLIFATQTSSAAELNFTLSGYDVVSYFSKSGPQKGKSNLALRYADKIYAFSSRENALKFQKNPAKYLPQYNGNCAYGMVYGAKSSVDPLVYEIVENKLFFLINHGTYNIWKKRASQNIKRSDLAWKKLSKNF